MSKLLSLKLQDLVFRDAEGIRKRNRKPRNAYFNEAIHLYNQLWKRKLLKKQLATESAILSGDSLEVLEVFEQLEDSLD